MVNYLFVLVVLELFVPLLPAVAPLFVLDEGEVFAGFAVFAPAFGFAAFALLADELPPLLAFGAEVFFPPLLSSKPPTASAATFNALTAAPVAAPIKISPATSFAVSKTGDEVFFVVFFGADFDFAEAALFVVDLAGAEVFFVVF